MRRTPWLLALLLGLCLRLAVADAENPTRGMRNVSDFGAVGDGVADDTAAFQAAMDAVHADGGGVVQIPTGKFLIRGHLVVPERVALEGVWRAPVRGEPFDAGSTLLAVAGKGEPEGEPFIKMSGSTVLKGLTIFYPEQVRANPPLAYPWTVQANGPSDNIAILDVTMINPYQAVDLGTYPAGRHTINNLHAYPLFRGLYINQCYDVGRIENIHFWPFWDIDPESPLWEFTKQNAEAFILGKADGEMGHNLFSIFYKVGMHFIEGPIYDEKREITGYAAGCGMYSNCYMDVTPCAVLVDAVMDTAGVTFTNASIMSQVVVGPGNRGPVKFTASGFWATSELASHAVTEGRGTVLFEGCHFNDWDRARKGAPCIDANNRRLLVTGCDFPTNRENHQIIALGPRVRSAVITSNLMPGGVNIINHAPKSADLQIALNAVEPKPGFVEEWLSLGPFPNPAVEAPAPGEPSRAGIDTDYLEALGGEANARFRPDTELEFGDGPGARRLRVQPLRADERHFLNLLGLYKQGAGVAYAFTWLNADSDQMAYFDLSLNDGGKVFVNGQEAYRRFSPLGMQCRPGTDLFEAPLKAGPNAVLVKIEDGGGRWEFVFEAYGEDGEALRGSLEFPNR